MATEKESEEALKKIQEIATKTGAWVDEVKRTTKAGKLASIVITVSIKVT
jgi:hypothetical protein